MKNPLKTLLKSARKQRQARRDTGSARLTKGSSSPAGRTPALREDTDGPATISYVESIQHHTDSEADDGEGGESAADFGDTRSLDDLPRWWFESCLPFVRVDGWSDEIYRAAPQEVDNPLPPKSKRRKREGQTFQQTRLSDFITDIRFPLYSAYDPGTPLALRSVHQGRVLVHDVPPLLQTEQRCRLCTSRGSQFSLDSPALGRTSAISEGRVWTVEDGSARRRSILVSEHDIHRTGIDESSAVRPAFPSNLPADGHHAYMLSSDVPAHSVGDHIGTPSSVCRSSLLARSLSLPDAYPRWSGALSRCRSRSAPARRSNTAITPRSNRTMSAGSLSLNLPTEGDTPYQANRDQFYPQHESPMLDSDLEETILKRAQRITLVSRPVQAEVYNHRGSFKGDRREAAQDAPDHSDSASSLMFGGPAALDDPAQAVREATNMRMAGNDMQSPSTEAIARNDFASASLRYSSDADSAASFVTAAEPDTSGEVMDLAQFASTLDESLASKSTAGSQRTPKLGLYVNHFLSGALCLAISALLACLRAMFQSVEGFGDDRRWRAENFPQPSDRSDPTVGAWAMTGTSAPRLNCPDNLADHYLTPSFSSATSSVSSRQAPRVSHNLCRSRSTRSCTHTGEQLENRQAGGVAASALAATSCALGAAEIPGHNWRTLGSSELEYLKSLRRIIEGRIRVLEHGEG